jgi:NADPH:quinone reductase-like Zn-dependent oxidoreductase
MRAARLHRFGAPDQLAIEEIENPELDNSSVLVRVLASGINPSDAKNVQGRFPQTTLPRIPGRDFAGVVVEAARTGLVGQSVFGSGGELGFTRDGASAELIAVPERAVCPKPEGMSFEQAGCAGTPFVTASLAISKSMLQAGETAAVLGAAGAVGSAAVQIARWRGATVIRVERRRREGAEPGTVFASEQPIDSAIRAVTEGRGVDVCIDTAGLTDLGLRSLARGGRLVVITAPANPRVPVDILSLYRNELHLAGVDSLKLDSIACAETLRSLLPGFVAGVLSVDLPLTTYVLDDAVRAYSDVLYHSNSGRCVLLPSGRTETASSLGDENEKNATAGQAVEHPSEPASPFAPEHPEE